MSKIIYQPPGKDDQYLIDEDGQQLLAYLYLYGPANPNELINHLNYRDSGKIVESIKDNLCVSETGLIEITETNQLTLDKSNIYEISITKEGKIFVKNFRFEITPPFSVQSYIEEMRKIEADIEDELQSIIHRLEYFDEEEHGSEDIENLIENVESYFNEIRENRI